MSDTLIADGLRTIINIYKHIEKIKMKDNGYHLSIIIDVVQSQYYLILS